MPYGVGAFLMFGLGSLPGRPAGRPVGPAPMMLVFFFGIGASSLLAGAGAERLAAGRRAHAAGRLLGDLPPGGHPDAGAAQPHAGRTIGSTGCRATWASRRRRCLTGFLVAVAGWRCRLRGARAGVPSAWAWCS
jgi:hypothetical protein